MNTKHSILANKLAATHYLTDGGLETVLIFHQNLDLPEFAAFDLLSSPQGEQTLYNYYTDYLAIAKQYGLGFILEAPTWRANADWATKLGYTQADTEEANRKAIALMERLRDKHSDIGSVLISGNMGPRGDGYVADAKMTVAQAEQYHRAQISVFADCKVDLVSAVTLNYYEEAMGIALAAKALGMPLVISFTVETDGHLPSGQPLADAIEQLDKNTGQYPAYYMINCAHPTHFEQTVQQAGRWRHRIKGIRGNASKCSHAELDEAETLDDGNPVELAQDYKRLQQYLPNLKVFGGCCGTDHRHVAKIAQACLL